MIVIELKTLAQKAAVIGAALICAAFGVFILISGFAHSASFGAENREQAEFFAALAPNDPQTQFAAGALADAEFDPANFDAAEKRFETAAALSPNNYLLWLQLGKSREANGSTDGAEKAYRQARRLAPHYSSVQWANGNFLVRRGNAEEGFNEIRKAVAGDPKLADPAILVARQIFDGDAEAVRNVAGDSPEMNAALAIVLAKENNFDDAVKAWQKIPAESKNADLRQKGEALAAQFAAGHKYRASLAAGSDVKADNDFAPRSGHIWNGGFESALQVEKAPLFDWQIGRGLRPQIALTDGQKFEGRYSLVIAFGTLGETEFRQISQTVAVEPGKSYELAFQYRSDAKTQAAVKWVVMNPNGNARLAESESISPSAEWKPGAVKFTVPEDADGVRILLLREGCSGTQCAITGSIWLDAFTLTAEK